MTHEHHEHDEHDAHGSHEHGAHDHVHHTHRPIDYTEAVEQYRAQKDAYFRDSPGSPVPTDERGAFTGLPYFPVDPTLRFEDLALEPYEGDEPVHFEIPTSDNRLRPAERAGVFRFAIGDEPCQLTAYALAGGKAESLFVPFLDATSGRETYGAGRYIDLLPEEDGSWSLDFNLAYHPSCVYDPRYSCPLTPAENRLAVPIEAGERLATA